MFLLCDVHLSIPLVVRSSCSFSWFRLHFFFFLLLWSIKHIMWVLTYCHPHITFPRNGKHENWKQPHGSTKQKRTSEWMNQHRNRIAYIHTRKQWFTWMFSPRRIKQPKHNYRDISVTVWLLCHHGDTPLIQSLGSLSVDFLYEAIACLSKQRRMRGKQKKERRRKKNEI